MRHFATFLFSYIGFSYSTNGCTPTDGVFGKPTLITAQSPTGTPSAPGVCKGRTPSARRCLRGLPRGPICRSIGTVGLSVAAKPSLDKTRCGDKFSATPKLRIDADQELIEMSRENTGTVHCCCMPSFRYESEGEYSPWQEHHRNIDYKEPHLLTPVLLGIGIGKRKDQCYMGQLGILLLHSFTATHHSPPVKTKPPKRKPAVSFRNVSKC